MGFLSVVGVFVVKQTIRIYYTLLLGIFARLLTNFKPHLCTTSQSSLRSPAPLVGEPLAKPETLRGMPRPPLVRGGGIAKQ